MLRFRLVLRFLADRGRRVRDERAVPERNRCTQVILLRHRRFIDEDGIGQVAANRDRGHHVRPEVLEELHELVDIAEILRELGQRFHPADEVSVQIRFDVLDLQRPKPLGLAVYRRVMLVENGYLAGEGRIEPAGKHAVTPFCIGFQAAFMVIFGARFKRMNFRRAGGIPREFDTGAYRITDAVDRLRLLVGLGIEHVVQLDHAARPIQCIQPAAEHVDAAHDIPCFRLRQRCILDTVIHDIPRHGFNRIRNVHAPGLRNWNNKASLEDARIPGSISSVSASRGQFTARIRRPNA